MSDPIPSQLLGFSKRLFDMLSGINYPNPPFRNNPASVKSLRPNSNQSLVQSSSLGTLDQLPAELLFQILGNVDVPSLCFLMRVSRKGQATVKDLSPVKNLTRFAPSMLSAMAEVKVLSYHPLKRLEAALYNDKCFMCGMPAGLLSLSTCLRVCEGHMFDAIQYLSVESAITELKLAEEQVAAIPSLSIPHPKKHQAPLLIVPFTEVLQLYKIVHRESAEASLIVQLLEALTQGRRPFPYRVLILDEYSLKSIERAQSRTWGDEIRIQNLVWTTIQVPFVLDGTASNGAGCQRCRWMAAALGNDEGTEQGLLLYTDLRAHFLSCKHVRDFLGSSSQLMLSTLGILEETDLQPES